MKQSRNFIQAYIYCKMDLDGYKNQVKTMSKLDGRLYDALVMFEDLGIVSIEKDSLGIFERYQIKNDKESDKCFMN
jgi:hypothetical protein